MTTTEDDRERRTRFQEELLLCSLAGDAIDGIEIVGIQRSGDIPTLVWEIAPKNDLPAVRAGRPALEQMMGLLNPRLKEATLCKRVLQIAQQYGPLMLCEHGLPYPHDRECFPTGRESVSDWVAWAEVLRAAGDGKDVSPATLRRWEIDPTGRTLNWLASGHGWRWKDPMFAPETPLFTELVRELPPPCTVCGKPLPLRSHGLAKYKGHRACELAEGAAAVQRTRTGSGQTDSEGTDYIIDVSRGPENALLRAVPQTADSPRPKGDGSSALEDLLLLIDPDLPEELLNEQIRYTARVHGPLNLCSHGLPYTHDPECEPSEAEPPKLWVDWARVADAANKGQVVRDSVRKRLGLPRGGARRIVEWLAAGHGLLSRGPEVVLRKGFFQKVVEQLSNNRSETADTGDRLCATCSDLLPEDTHPITKYCKEKCRRMAKRRNRQAFDRRETLARNRARRLVAAMIDKNERGRLQDIVNAGDVLGASPPKGRLSKFIRKEAAKALLNHPVRRSS